LAGAGSCLELIGTQLHAGLMFPLPAMGLCAKGLTTSSLKSLAISGFLNTIKGKKKINFREAVWKEHWIASLDVNFSPLCVPDRMALVNWACLFLFLMLLFILLLLVVVLVFELRAS
jgi:hypothetical protein